MIVYHAKPYSIHSGRAKDDARPDDYGMLD